MLKVLLKKQLAEVFKTYFYDAKKNRMRSKLGIAFWFIFFFVVMVVMLGGIFTALSISLCGGLVDAGMGWLYFLLMGVIAIVLGAFGSVFNTYTSLYISKDNDLLLSMPIPVRTIITARLINVWLMGAMYSVVVFIPALIVYWITVGATASKVICGLLMLLIVTIIVLLLSCILGWAVAKISLRLKNKSFITVLISLLFIGAYYFVYFKANDFIRQIIANADNYGSKIKGAAYGLYLFGRVGEGDFIATAIVLAVTAVLGAIVWTVLSKSFMSIATSSGNTKKVKYVEKSVREKSAFRALLGKEFARFTSSANYMLNCGLGTLLIPAFGVLLLIKGQEFASVVDGVLSGRPDSAAVLICTGLCMLASMNDMATPTVSLEGKSIWIPQSLPIAPKTVIRAKYMVQIILTGIPMLFSAVCCAAVIHGTAGIKILCIVMPMMYVLFSALYGMLIGVRMPLLNWTNETAPIKQSGMIALILFSSWGIVILIGALYLIIGYKAGAAAYLGALSIVFAVLSLIIFRWLDTKGAGRFAAL